MDGFQRTRGDAIEGKPRPVPPHGEGQYDGGGPGQSPADLLGLEQHLIARVLRILRRQSASIREGSAVDPVFLTIVADFIATYVGRVHHGKEEEILLRELDDRDLAPEERREMEELVQDHVQIRRLVSGLEEGIAALQEGQEGAPEAILDAISGVLEIYLSHMDREDEVFFPAATDYLTDSDRAAVLECMPALDRAMIHEKYASVAEELEGRTEQWGVAE